MITKRVISFFTFGLFLIIVGAISNYFDWTQANLIMSIGLVFELLASLIFIWNKLKK